MPSANSLLIAKFRSFLTQIGIDTREQPLPDPTFLPGLLIHNGTLLIDPERLLYPGDILHEAGHIAVSLPADRAGMGGNVTENNPDKAGEEMAVLLWTYAACLHLAIDPRVVFHPAGYLGQSDWLVKQFTNGEYVGLPLLVWMGLTETPTPDKPGHGFPHLTQWLRT